MPAEVRERHWAAVPMCAAVMVSVRGRQHRLPQPKLCVLRGEESFLCRATDESQVFNVTWGALARTPQLLRNTDRVS